MKSNLFWIHCNSSILSKMSHIKFATILLISSQLLLLLSIVHSAPTNSKKDDQPRFSIGLGVLAPSYSQKFDGNGRLDFNQEENGGFSFSLNNVHVSPKGTPAVAAGQSQSPSQASSQYAPQNNYVSTLIICLLMCLICFINKFS